MSFQKAPACLPCRPGIGERSVNIYFAYEKELFGDVENAITEELLAVAAEPDLCEAQMPEK